MDFRLGCELEYEIEGPATLLFNLEAARTDQQLVRSENLGITPDTSTEPYVMPASANRYRRLLAKPGHLRLRYQATVDLHPFHADPATIAEVPVSHLPFATLPHLYPSRYAQADRVERWAIRQFGNMAPGHSRVTAICNWIHDHLEYRRGTSDAHTSAYDTLVERAGVCRDFAHLGIAFCRALGIPARFVSAYAWRLEPADFHAVFEAYLGGRWYLFDPTRQAALDGVVRIGFGQDAAEVSFASLYGPARPTQMSVWIEPAQALGSADQRTISAVSISAV
jgi:transglutaminase-like putative cysteine protease